MSSYLETYGASEEQHARRIGILKTTAITVISVLILGGILYGIFKNHFEEQQIKTFAARLEAKDFPGAYQLWGCSEAHPCADYPYEKFLEDWGPKSGHAGVTPDISSSSSCGSGVMIGLTYKGTGEPINLWVERDTKAISFAPWAECPGRHLHLGAWLRSLFNR